MAIDKETLLKRRFGVEEVKLNDGSVVEIRALSHAEALGLQARGELELAEMERVLVAIAMVSPSLTEDEVGIWQENSPAGELQVIVNRITEISGMQANATKSGVLGAGE